jgi:hypothetical protein
VNYAAEQNGLHVKIISEDTGKIIYGCGFDGCNFKVVYKNYHDGFKFLKGKELHNHPQPRSSIENAYEKMR